MTGARGAAGGCMTVAEAAAEFGWAMADALRDPPRGYCAGAGDYRTLPPVPPGLVVEVVAPADAPPGGYACSVPARGDRADLLLAHLAGMVVVTAVVRAAGRPDVRAAAYCRVRGRRVEAGVTVLE